MIHNRLATAIALTLSASFTAGAENDFFDPINIDLDNTSQSSSSMSSFDQKGFVLQKFKYGVDTPLREFGFDRNETGLSQVQTDWFQEFRGIQSDRFSWQLSFKAEVDWLQWRNGEQQWRTNHEKLFLKDAFVDVVFDNGTWMRAGHQIFAWRQSESLLAISDVLSPMDLREPGQAELRDIREHIPAVLVSIPVAEAKFSTVLTYDAGHNRYADTDEEFYPYVAITRYGLNMEALEPEKDWELAVKLDYQFNGGDLSFVAADINDNDLAFRRLSADFSTAIFTQERVRMFGMAANKVRGSWLFKMELGRFQDQPVANTAGLPWMEFNQLRSMLGVEYSGWDNWQVNVELSNIYLSNHDSLPADSGMDIEKSPLGYLFRLRNTALNDRLENRFWLMDIIGSEGEIFRWDLSYEMNDHWEVGTAVVIYQADDRESTFYPFQNHDSVNFSIQYHY